MPALKLITTEDGSHSLLDTGLSETYHSTKGALRESLHVFIRHGLDWYVSQTAKRPIQLFEMGFGTGLNAFLALQYAMDSKTTIHYHGIDIVALEQALVDKLNYPEAAGWPGGAGMFSALHSLPWDMPHRVHPNFLFTKTMLPIGAFRQKPGHNDVVFFDAFAPSKQASVWDKEILQDMYASMKRGAVLVTYCARGQFKRDLAAVGFTVEVLPGPPGKREMVRAIRR
jgi:tRNA U34 5-methylaminomethyl-2-thiouridine-forming methyltransferase MnmC